MRVSIDTIRLVLFVVINVLSIIVLGLGSYLIDAMKRHFDHFGAAFAVAIATLTLSTLPALIVIGLVRRGTFFNYVFAEFTWLTVLWALWLTSATFTGGIIFPHLPSKCDFTSSFFGSIWDKINCGEVWAIQAFSLLIWLILTVYTILLFVLTIKQQKRGRSWTKHRAGTVVIADMAEASRTPDNERLE